MDMIRLFDNGVTIQSGKPVAAIAAQTGAKEKTIAAKILAAHDHPAQDGQLHITFDGLISHDITYVGIIQTARASGLTRFPVPYVLTNCHNSLCAVGGTINEDDHVFGLSAAIKYGGDYVPANQAVIHQYAREMMTGCGKMLLGSDSHTRYGAIGTMGIGEGGPELVKQLLQNTYDVAKPQVVLVWLTGEVPHGVGPHDVAIALCGAVYKNGLVKNKILEFAGPGVKALPMDFRIGIDVMTTETACLSSIWETDEKVEEYLAIHGRPDSYRALRVEEGAYYDGCIEIDLSSLEPMAALPFHPSEAVPLRELIANPGDYLREVELRAHEQFGGKAELHLTEKIEGGKLQIDQGVIAGCSGGMYDNIAEAASILRGFDVGCGDFSLSVYPPSIPVNLELIRNGVQQELLEAGALFKPCFCGPCFGAGDVPSNNGLSIRHTTRNFPNREGSKPGQGQLSLVALMDARSIAATAANGGAITAATDVEYENTHKPYAYDEKIYKCRVYNGYGRPRPETELRYGPNIKDWPTMYAMQENMLLELAAVIHDPVTTTDELIPSGETSSYRSNPLKLSEFALSRRVPEYVGLSKEIQKQDLARRAGEVSANIAEALAKVGAKAEDTSFGSCVFANRPGDGSAREQAASCQKVLGGDANVCYEYATKRYRSNCINWGIVPFTIAKDVEFNFEPGDKLFVPGIREAILAGKEEIDAQIIARDGVKPIHLFFQNLTADERQILADGCLMNYYKNKK